MAPTKDKSNGSASRRYQLRVKQETWERIRTIAERETKRQMMPISYVDIIRKCIELGLQKIERGESR